MRDLAKSMMRLSGAMSVLAADRAASLFGSQALRSVGGPASAQASTAQSTAQPFDTQAFDALSRTAEAQLSAPARDFFHAGDRVQRTLVDEFFLDPSQVLRTAADFFERSADQLTARSTPRQT